MSNSVNVLNFHMWILFELFHKKQASLIDLFIKQCQLIS